MIEEVEEIEEKTGGFAPFVYCGDKPLFQTCAGVSVKDALSQASDLLCLSKSLSEDAAFAKDTDRYAWAAHFLTEMGKAVIDDVIKAVSPKSKPIIFRAK